MFSICVSFVLAKSCPLFTLLLALCLQDPGTRRVYPNDHVDAFLDCSFSLNETQKTTNNNTQER